MSDFKIQVDSPLCIPFPMPIIAARCSFMLLIPGGFSVAISTGTRQFWQEIAMLSASAEGRYSKAFSRLRLRYELPTYQINFKIF